MKAPKITLFGTSDNKVNNRKFAAILLLTEYCNKLPALLYNHLVNTGWYYKLFDSLGDPQIEIRHATVDFFKAISRLILQRDPNERKTFYERIYQGISNVLRSKADEKVLHGCLITMSFLFSDSGDFLGEHHDMMIKYVNVLAEKKKDLIRPQCIQLFPIIAQHAPLSFSKYDDKIIRNLLEIGKSKSSMKGQALKALGK